MPSLHFLSRTRLATLAAISGALLLAACASAPPAPPLEVKLIAFSDFHGALLSPGRFSENLAGPSPLRPEVGGADALAAHVAQLKAQQPRNVVLAAGDLVSASPMISAFFHDEPTVEALNAIGVEFSAAGNHEFDRGVPELLRLQHGGCKPGDGVPDPNSCRGSTAAPFAGANFQWLAANVIDTARAAPLLPPWAVKRFDGVDLAFVGVTLRSTPNVVMPSAVAGLRFDDEADAVNALLPELRARGIEAIVLLAHQGGAQTGSHKDINACDGDLAGSPLADIVARLDDAVDLVISGHTHMVYNCSASTTDLRVRDAEVDRLPRASGLPNAAGRRVPVVSPGAYARVLSDIDLQLDRGRGEVREVRVRNRLVRRDDGVLESFAPAAASAAAIVAHYEALAAPLAQQVIGHIAAELPNRIDEAGNMPAGELVADAQLAATAAPATGGAQLALMNPGGVRAPGFRFTDGGAVRYGDAFTVQPFGNSLITLTLTGEQLKTVLEQQFAGCRGQTRTRLLIPARSLRYQWSANAACDARIRNLALLADDGSVREHIVDAAGRVLAPQQRYRLTVNSYLAAGGDGFDTFLAAQDALGGGLDIDALAAYLGRFMPPGRAAYAPDAAQGRPARIQRLP